MYIENIVIGEPLVRPSELLSCSMSDWIDIEQPKTIYVEERSLAKILVKYELTKSIGELKRNRPDLAITLDKVGFLEIKLGKRRLWIIVGE